MSFIRLTAQNLQTYKTITRPKRLFSSSSAGVTGSVKLTVDYSDSIKDIGATFSEENHAFNDEQAAIQEELLQLMLHEPTATDADVWGKLFEVFNAEKHKIKQTKVQEIRRFIPGTRFEDNFGKKATVQRSLFPYYKDIYPSADWSYTNYHCLNFFTASSVPSNSVLIYPSRSGSSEVNSLAPSSSFTFDFYIKPRTTSEPYTEYNPGTILHMSSCYSVSLITGSGKSTIDAKPDGFRILFQLSQSADIPPSSLVLDGNSNISSDDNISTKHAFVSKDNSLSRDHWHHVSIRWSSSEEVKGIGDISIDGSIDTIITASEKIVMQATSSTQFKSDPDALFVGNYYEGINSGSTSIARFFSPDANEREGVISLGGLSGNPDTFIFGHPLNAEIHDIKIYDRFLLDSEVEKNKIAGTTIDTPGLKFYVPPFFVRESRQRQIPQTPFISVSGSSKSPFNVPLSFGVAGLDINLENFTRDFISKNYPRLFNLTSSLIEGQVSSEGLTATDVLYLSGSSRKRNLTILPCDNGKFLPNFNILASGSTRGLEKLIASDRPESSFIDDQGNHDRSKISLNYLITGSSPSSMNRLFSLGVDARTFDDNGNPVTGSIIGGIIASTPEDLGADQDLVAGRLGYYLSGRNILTVFQRTGDSSSNEVVFFDVSNLFYGDRIYPGSVKLFDSSATGSNGDISFLLRDDSLGNLYRADAKSENATWASIGTVLYEEGIIVIKSPHLPLFGKDGFEIEFQGERNVHTMEYSIPVPAGMFNSSSNPCFRRLRPSENKNDPSDEFVYLTGIKFHDNNLNVLMNTTLAQPIIKRDADRLVVKVRVDF